MISKKPQEKKIVTLTASDFAEHFLYLNSQPYSLSDYPHMRTVFNIDAQDVVLMTGRQVSKSTTEAAIQISRSVLIPGYKSMYVSPTVDQTKIYSYDRLSPFLEGSPWIKKHYMSSSLVQNVFFKQLLNGSKLYLRYALLTADRLRGYSVDHIFYDECQDLLLDIIPVADEAMSRSYYKKRHFAGTPKTTRTTLAHFWGRSTKNEWFVKCGSCSRYNYLDEKNIGSKGLVCRYCDHLLDPKNGVWSRTGDVNAPFEGFRVCQLQFFGAPWVNWRRDVLLKYETYSRGIFFNEVLGLEYDPGVTPVTLEEVKACCTGGPMTSTPNPNTGDVSFATYMGIDYGPATSENSFTVLCALQERAPGRYKIPFIKKYTGQESDFHFIHQDVPVCFGTWRAKAIGADYGLGEASNSEIRASIGHRNLVPFFHSGNQKERLKYNPTMGAMTTNRVRVMTEFFTMIKKRNIEFPCWDQFEPFARDILAVGIDYSVDNTKMKYVNAQPDDSLHAMIYALLTCQLDAGSRVKHHHEFVDDSGYEGV